VGEDGREEEPPGVPVLVKDGNVLACVNGEDVAVLAICVWSPVKEARVRLWVKGEDVAVREIVLGSTLDRSSK
jgi:hypothetical protein